MKTVRTLLVLGLLLVAGLVVGCSEQYAHKSASSQWRSTGTGYWGPDVAHLSSSPETMMGK